MEAPGHVPSVPSPKSGSGCPHKVYIERKNMQVELVRFRTNIAFIHVYFFEPRNSTDSRVYAWIVATT